MIEVTPERRKSVHNNLRRRDWWGPRLEPKEQGIAYNHYLTLAPAHAGAPTILLGECA